MIKPFEKIETEQLILRKPILEDAHAVFEGWAQDPEVTRYLVWRPPKRIEETKSFIQSCIIAWETDKRFPYIVVIKESNQVAGMIDPRIEDHKIGVGYVLGRDHWGKGYMTEASKAVIDWAFQQEETYRVYATTDVDNIGSQRVLEKSGMVREGLLQRYMMHPNVSDEPRDCYMYAVVK
ncbi:MAG TPA: GNAT family N-acetyltransferase [Anaerolineales bacterium]|nr:GNAT family N-acetyltransferase [Anaerolineales bacterium]